MVALGAAVMIVGAAIEVLDFTICAFASLLVVFVYLEIGSFYPWLVWICTTLATGLLYPGSIIWMEYLLVFGIYPLIKAYVERLPKLSWIIVKLVYINAVVLAIFAVTELLLGIPFFEDGAGTGMKIFSWVLLNVAFVAYDFFISTMVRFYYAKLRPRFKKFLK